MVNRLPVRLVVSFVKNLCELCGKKLKGVKSTQIAQMNADFFH
jgi:hypothetical protein